MYTVNNHIKQHINILAKIVTPELTISHSDVVLRPTLGVPQTYGRKIFENKFATDTCTAENS